MDNNKGKLGSQKINRSHRVIVRRAKNNIRDEFGKIEFAPADIEKIQGMLPGQAKSISLENGENIQCKAYNKRSGRVVVRCMRGNRTLVGGIKVPIKHVTESDIDARIKKLEKIVELGTHK